ncbi:MAG: FKBP-type peptidyl-prolyl cis-trans isomerase [Phycisphaeraceae bacterium]|nr:FKBP-type peptidyl-prolyl cis-trans isomerase [Phycisphaeraceae bacterium]
MFKTLSAIALTLTLTAGFAFAADKGHEGHDHATTQPAATQPATTHPAMNPVDIAAASMEPVLTPLQKASYGIGFSMGQQIGQMGEAVDLTVLISGLTDSVQGNEPQFTQEQLKAAFAALDAHMSQKTNQAGTANVKEGDDFLKANAAKEGVKTTASGLQYKITKVGTGKSPTATDTVRVHYRGTFIDGKTFDSSYDRGEPVEFPLSGVIPGWTEGLQLIKEGGKAMLWIPGDLAYGPQGRGEIPPSATLIFEIELLEVK